MKRLRSPQKNRRGVYEEHNVPERKVARLLDQGWVEVCGNRLERVGEHGPEIEAVGMPRAFSEPVDLSGNWMKARAKTRDLLGLDRLPGSKPEAAALLRDAGYEVVQ